MRKVINISEDQHWADYAELLTPPQPDYERAKDNLFYGLRNRVRFNWNLCISIALAGLLWAAIYTFGKMVWLEFFSK